ncbi:MAG: ABC transporter substrate-binding protein [Actinomycetota bacterium]
MGVLLLAACGNDGDDTASSSEAGGSATEAAGSSAEAGASEAAAPVSVTDGLGRTVTLDQPAERIACRDSGCSLVLAELGLVPVATFFEPNRAAFYYGEESIGDITFAPDGPENTIATEPDLLVINLREADLNLEQYEVLIPTYVIDDSGNLAENAAKLTADIAALSDRVVEGEQSIAEWERFVGSLAEIEISGVEDVRLLQLWGGAPDSYQGWMSNSDWCVLLDDLDLVGQCVFDPPVPGSDFSEFSAEAILAEQPTHISYLLEWQYGGEFPQPEDRTDPTWSQLDAVAAGNVYVVPSTGNFANAYHEIIYELENYLFHVYGPAQGFEDPGPFTEWDGPSL